MGSQHASSIDRSRAGSKHANSNKTIDWSWFLGSFLAPTVPKCAHLEGGGIVSGATTCSRNGSIWARKQSLGFKNKNQFGFLPL